MDSIRKYEENQEYYENLDKRTKEYKTYSQWKENREAASEGLGDSIEKITEATGIKAAVKFIAGEDCGCDERKEKLNELFGYRKPECLLEEEYNYLKDLFSKRVSVIDINTQRELIKISNRVFNRNQRPSSCSSCIKKMYDNLKKYFDAYDK
jgi:hypothetical protein